MTEINVNNYAKLIAQKLDSQDSKAGDNKIEASIWNQFVAGKGGNTIKHSITLDNAIKSISSYLVNNAKALGKSVETVAKEWLGFNPANVIENKGAERSDSTSNGNVSIDDLPTYPELTPEQRAELEARYEKAVEISKTEKASNGLTYAVAKEIIGNIRQQFKYANAQFKKESADDPGHWDLWISDAEFLTLLERACQSDYDNDNLKQILNEFRRAYNAMTELEAKYPDLANIDNMNGALHWEENVKKIIDELKK